MTPPRTIHVRYSMRASLYPIIFTVLTAYLLRDSSFSPFMLAVSLLALPLLFRPFLVVDDGRARFVSLVSNSIFREMELSALRARLPSMRWFLRRSDLIQLESYLKEHP